MFTVPWTGLWTVFLGFMANYEKKELINHSSVILHQMAPHLFFKKDLCSLKSIFPQFVNFLFFSWFWIFSGAWRFPWDSSLYWCRFSLYGVPKIQSPNHQRKCCLKWSWIVLCQIMQISNKNKKKTGDMPHIRTAVMWTIWTLVWTTNFTNAQNVEWSGVESSDEKSFRS